MITAKHASLALALALGAAGATACVADAPMMPEVPGAGSDGTGDDPGTTAHATDVAGTYKLQSTFDIASNLPGKVGVVANAFIDATDDPDDPTRWILDQIIAKSSGTLKSALSSAEPFVAGYLNDRLLDIAPDFVTTMVQVGKDFGDVSKHFGINETLTITGAAGAYTSEVRATGIHIKIDTDEQDLVFADNQVADVVVPGVGITLDATGRLGIAAHKLPLSYGKVLQLALDKVVIPAIDPTAHNLKDLLVHQVDCQAVGAAIDDALYDQFGFGGGASTWAAACTAGLTYGANAITAKIADIDKSALEFGLTGTAKAVDTNKDGKADKLQTGTWTGTLTYAGTPAPLSTATFAGARM